MLSIFEKRELPDTGPEWLKFAFVVGYDDGDDAGGDDAGDEGGDGDDADDGADDSDDESSLEGLKKALAKERALRGAAEKKARILTKNAAGRQKATDAADDDGDDNDEGDGADDKKTGGKKRATASDAKIAKLTTTIRTQSLQAVVSDLAKQFHKPADVYLFLDTAAFDYEQDEDDATNVVWDEAEIRAAIKALAKDRPYLVKPAAEGDQSGTKRTRSGPKFAGSGSGRQTGASTQEQLAQRIPAFRSAVRATKTKSE